MLALAAAVLAASASASAGAPASVLEASVPWFERITVTVDDKGAQQSCRYQFSLSSAGAEPCPEAIAATVPTRKARGGPGAFSKLTFERRFSPGMKIDSGRLQPGDKLLAQQVMHLTFAADGSIASCRVVGRSGDLVPAYGCDEARAEQFRHTASAPADAPRQAFMTIIVYGHQEQIA